MLTSSLSTSSSGGVLVASPSSSLREKVLLSLHDHRWPVQEAMGGAEALVKLETGNWQVLFLDRCLPDLDAEELVGIIKRRYPGIEVFVLDSGGAQSSLAASLRDLTTARRWLSPAPAHAAAKAEPEAFHETTVEENSKSELPAAKPLPGMIGNTQPMQRLYELARLVARRHTTVLITGPTGTGKELVARAIHQLSPRSGRPFVVVNCAAIPEALLESELFGHTRGAFTGAVQAYSGRIHAAQGGTLFLDEVGELPLGLQAKLLRFLDLKEVQRLGSSDSLRVDVRVLAAANYDLGKAVNEGGFRGDLYYRLAAFPLEVPPLATRIADIEILAGHFLEQIAGETKTPPLTLSAEAVAMLQDHPWQGNVRELRQLMERAAILACDETIVTPKHLYFPGTPRTNAPRPVPLCSAR